MPTNPRERKRRASGLRRELEPTILPRQLRTLEAVAARLDEERPAPTADFRARLGLTIGELGSGGEEGDAGAPSFRVPAAAYAVSGFALLLVAALWVGLGG